MAYLFDQAAQNGAFIHSDSWGDTTFGLYSIYEEMVDTYVWGNQDFLPVFAAGNDGTDGYYSSDATNYLAEYGIVIPDASKNGMIDSMSIGSPSHAKNVLAVGATESDRTTGPASSQTWMYRHYLRYSIDPIKSDLVTVGSLNSNGYHQGMAAFSSRGPTFRGRTKPDVTTPGSDVISTRSSVSGAGTGWGVYTPNNQYLYCGGTSMACPLAAGAAALVREHLVEREGFQIPTAALIRATLVNGAKSIFPGQYGTGAFQEVPNATPNYVEGWGQVNVGEALYQQGAGNLFIDRIFNGTLRGGQSGYLDVTVVNTNVPLRVTLAWADYPLRPWATYSEEIVNDLDLMIDTPASEVVWGNGVADGDRKNTVERVIIEHPEVGTYTVSIIAHNIMVSGSLPALVISGGIAGTQPIVVPERIDDTSPRMEGYLATAHVHSVFPYTVTNPVDFAWALGDANSATSTWTHVAVAAEADDQTYLWIDVFAGAGTNNGAAAYHVLTNGVAVSRSGSILVFGGDITNTVSVLQGAWNKQPEMPQLASPVFSMGGEQVSLSFIGERNSVYTLQGKVALSDPEWIDLDTQTVYNDGIVTLVAGVFPGYPTLPDTAFFRIKAVALASE